MNLDHLNTSETTRKISNSCNNDRDLRQKLLLKVLESCRLHHLELVWNLIKDLYNQNKK
jgi:hypothetical protein